MENTTIFYRIQERTAELWEKERRQIEPGITSNDPDPDEIFRGTEEECMAEMSKLKTCISFCQCLIGTLIYVTEYELEKVTYDEEWEEEVEWETLDVSDMNICVCNEDDEVLASFDNYAEAEDYMYWYEEEHEEEEIELHLEF